MVGFALCFHGKERPKDLLCQSKAEKNYVRVFGIMEINAWS